MLVALSNVKKTHITNLVRLTNSTYNEVRRNLDILEREGILAIQGYGNMKMIELDVDNPKTMKLLKALQTLRTSMESAS